MFLNTNAGKDFVKFLTDKQLTLIDNIKSLKDLYKQLKAVQNLELAIIVGLDSLYFSLEDSSEKTIAKDIKVLATIVGGKVRFIDEKNI